MYVIRTRTEARFDIWKCSEVLAARRLIVTSHNAASLPERDTDPGSVGWISMYSLASDIPIAMHRPENMDFRLH